jgi:hypothetical protein
MHFPKNKQTIFYGNIDVAIILILNHTKNRIFECQAL